MKLLFKQRFFSWLDSYDIFDESGNTRFQVKGELAWGHKLKVFNSAGQEVGMIKQVILTWLPKYEVYIAGNLVGTISREFTWVKAKYKIDYKGWRVDGSYWEWDYQIYDSNGECVAVITKELFNWTDTYSMDIKYERDTLGVLMFVLAIDCEKCSRNNH